MHHINHYYERTEQSLRNKITIISWICCFLVMYIHNNNLTVYGYDEYSSGEWDHFVYMFEYTFSKVTNLAVPLFFLLSGFLFFRTFKWEKLWTKYKSRFFSLVIPYFIWACIYYLYFVILSYVPGLSAMISSDSKVTFSLISLLRWIGPDSYYTLWFIKNLILYVLLTPIFYGLFKNHSNKFPTGIVVLFISLVFRGIWDELTFVNLKGLPWYAIGAWFGMNHKDWVMRYNRSWSWIALIYICLHFVTRFTFWNFWTQILFYVALWLALDFFPFASKTPWWMSITFFVYVAHDLLLKPYAKIFYIVFGNYPAYALRAYILLPWLVYFTLAVIAYILQRRLPKIWSVLNGARKS